MIFQKNKVLFNTLKKAKIIFWDFDGVIKESINIKSLAFENLFQSFGEEVVARVAAHHVQNGGMSRFEKMPVYLEWAGEVATENKVAQYCQKFSDMVMQDVVNSSWVPGVREYILDNYRNHKYILVTATPHDEIIEITKLIKIFHCFSSIHGSPRSKSSAIKKELIEHCCSPSEALMIGDAKVDYDAALSNQVKFIFREDSALKTQLSDFCGLRFSNFL